MADGRREPTGKRVVSQGDRQDAARGGRQGSPQYNSGQRGSRVGPGVVEFVNPYNFVRLGNPAARKPPDSRRAFTGKSGKIICKLETKTPIFIPDPSKTEENEGSPKKMFFIRENGQPIIPATSIKGMVRSVAEAVSGSCLSQFDGGRLDHRPIGSLKKAGRVKSLPKGGEPGEITEMGVAWIAMPGQSTEVKLDKYGREKKYLAIAQDKNGKPFKDGQDIFVRVERLERYFNSRGRQIPGSFFLVTEISDTQGTDFKKGTLRITGKSIPNKKRERVFFELDNPRVHKFDRQAKEDYDYILEVQKCNASRRGVDLYRRSEELSVGDLVYFETETRQNESWAKNISRVEVPRRRYMKGRADRLPQGFAPCSNVMKLCPACRLFGTVLKEAGEGEEHVALAGKVAFTDARLANESEAKFKFLSLKPLSSPKPTSCNFYLADNPDEPRVVRDYDGHAIKRREDSGSIYVDTSDTNEVFLRGRKFYWHQSYDSTLNRYVIDKEERERLGISAEQVSEVEALLPGARFTFEVEFSGLSDEELGLLLWSLELEDGMMHKLGMGKPLGLGSVKITAELEVIDARDLYTMYDVCFKKGEDAEKIKSKCLEIFKDGVKEINGVSEFEQARSVSDLMNIMSFKPDSVSYPPAQRTRSGELRGFVWFMRNKHVPLITVEDIKKRKKMS